MNRRLCEAIERIRNLSEERQQQATSLLLDFLEENDQVVELRAEQKVEIDEALSEDEAFASYQEVQEFFDRVMK